MKTIKTMYNVSWSPWQGEATYRNGFQTEAERDQFISRIKARSLQTWETEYLINVDS
jgi:hypothetical protein